MTIKLAVFDLDQTLITTGERITDRTAAHVASLVADGLPVALASARLDESIAVVNEAIGPRLAHISYNGALTTLADGTIVREVGFTIGDDLAAALAAFTERATIDVYCSDGRWLAYGQDDAIDREEHDTWCTADLRAPHASAADLAGLRVRKVMLEGANELVTPLYEIVAGMDGINLTHSSLVLHDVWPADSGKGNALAALCEALGLTADEVIAVGDSQTDLPMVEFAGTSIAVRPGSDVLAAAATETVEGPGSDALFAAVRRLAGLPACD